MPSSVSLERLNLKLRSSRTVSFGSASLPPDHLKEIISSSGKMDALSCADLINPSRACALPCVLDVKQRGERR
jgi:hypothetical protein